VNKKNGGAYKGINTPNLSCVSHPGRTVIVWHCNKG